MRRLMTPQQSNFRRHAGTVKLVDQHGYRCVFLSSYCVRNSRLHLIRPADGEGVAKGDPRSPRAAGRKLVFCSVAVGCDDTYQLAAARSHQKADGVPRCGGNPAGLDNYVQRLRNQCLGRARTEGGKCKQDQTPHDEACRVTHPLASRTKPNAAKV